MGTERKVEEVNRVRKTRLLLLVMVSREWIGVVGGWVLVCAQGEGQASKQ